VYASSALIYSDEPSARRVSQALRSLERFQQLSSSGFVAETQVQQRQEELIDLQVRVDSALRTQNALSRELGNARAELASVDMQLATDLAQIDRAAAAASQDFIESDATKLLLRATQEDGTLP
jgi:hypothetical protein